MEIRTLRTHYMTFPHNLAGILLGDWTKYLYKNGERDTATPISLRESPLGIYTFAFDNDGETESHWTLIVWPTDDADIRYGESWIVRNGLILSTVLDIQSTVDAGLGSRGGIGGSVGTAIGKP